MTAGSASAPHDTDLVTARALFFRGSAWSLVDYGGTQLLRLASNTILWRLLFEEAFGLMTLVNALIMGLAMFSDVGIGPGIVQHERGDDPDYLNTAWTIQAIRGALLFSVACLVALPAARFYHQPQLVPLLLLVASTTVIQGFNSTNLFSASRHLALKQLALIDFTSQLVGTMAMIAVAWTTRSVWSLTVSGIVSSILRLLFGHLLLPGIKNRFRWDRSAVSAMGRFGRWVFLSTLLTFLAMNSDRLIFGKVLPIGKLGVYGIASIWATLPSSVLARIFGTVAFPLLSRAKNLGESIGPVFRDTRGKVLLVGAWVTSGLIAGAPPLVRLLYDRRASDAVWIVPLLASGGWFAALENTNSNAALSVGQPKWLAAANGAKVAGMAALIPLGGVLGGFPGAIIGLAFSDVFKYLVSAVGAVRVGVTGWRQDAVLTLGIAAISALTIGARRLTGAEQLPAAVDALLVTVVATAGWAAIWWVRARRHAARATAEAAGTDRSAKG